MRTDYSGYYRDHYGSSFTEADVLEWTKWFRTQWAFIRTKVPLDSGCSVLEIGAGFGGFYSLIEDQEIGSYLGLDLDPDVVDFANSFFKTDRFEFKSLAEIANRVFDNIFAFEVLEHIQNPSEVVSQVFDGLSDGGYFCGTTPFPYRWNIESDETHVSVLHPMNWKRLFMLEGFRSVDTFAMSFLPLIWRLDGRANFRIPMYVPIKNMVSTTLIVAQK